jgi:hypothetical protein
MIRRLYVIGPVLVSLVIFLWLFTAYLGLFPVNILTWEWIAMAGVVVGIFTAIDRVRIVRAAS